MSEHNLKEIPAICGLCPHGCWVHAYVSKGELIGVTADSDRSYGSLCGRGKLAPQIIYSADRIKTPLIRNGQKGKIAFKQASWDEAIDRMACEFVKIKDTYNASAVASYMGAGTLEDGLIEFFADVFAPFGSLNDMNSGSVCYVSSRILAPVTTLGIPADSITTDFENSDVIILWGANPFKDGLPDKMRRIQKARSKGAKLIIVDPRRHRLTKNADFWIPLIPGTDGALILAIIRTIIENGWYDRNFVEKWTSGFEELKEYVSHFTSHGASWICGVDTETIQWLAATIARTRRVAIDFYSGLEYAPSGVQNTRALYSLIALTGNLDINGGLYIHEYPHKPFDEYTFDGDTPPLGSREYPLFYALTGKAHISGLPAAVLHDDPYPVRGLLVVGGSPLRSHPDPITWKQVYEKLDFMAVIDRFMPEEAKWADMILPATTYYEIDSYQVYREHMRLRRKIIEPVGEARNDCLILAALAQKLGFGNAFPQDEKEIINQALRKRQLSLDQAEEGSEVFNLSLPERRSRKYESGHLRHDGQPGFPTPTGKFEFRSTLLERYGYEPLPVYTDPRRTDFNGGSPLMLTTGARSRARFNSQYLDRPELAERNKVVVEINPVDASARGVRDGDIVSVLTASGQMLLKALITEDICTGVIHIPYGGGCYRQIEPWRRANVNTIVPPEVRDPISGYPVLKAVMCDVVLHDEKQRVRTENHIETHHSKKQPR
jgi:anaerobic selenocysteine-containing dehydrogenase